MTSNKIYSQTAWLYLFLVFKRCISGLPPNECPLIPKRYLLQHSRKPRSATVYEIPESDSVIRRVLRENSNNSNVAQYAAQTSNGQCEERRQVGQEILFEKIHRFDSWLSRFVGNFLMHFSNSTNSQQVIFINLCFFPACFSRHSPFIYSFNSYIHIVY